MSVCNRTMACTLNLTLYCSQMKFHFRGLNNPQVKVALFPSPTPQPVVHNIMFSGSSSACVAYIHYMTKVGTSPGNEAMYKLS